MSLQIRLAQQRDIAHLMAVERSAAQLFRQQPEWRFIAEGEVMAPQQHAAFIAERREWLAESDNGECAGFIAVQVQGAIGTSPNCRSPAPAAAGRRPSPDRRGGGRGQTAGGRPPDAHYLHRGAVECALLPAAGISAARGRAAHGRPAAARMRIWRMALPPAVAVPWNLHYRKY